MFRLLKLAPFIMMAWRFYKGQKAKNAMGVSRATDRNIRR